MSRLHHWLDIRHTKRGCVFMWQDMAGEEFDTEFYDVQGRYIGRWRMGYLPEWDRVISLYPLDEQPPTYQNGGNTEWRQP